VISRFFGRDFLCVEQAGSSFCHEMTRHLFVAMMMLTLIASHGRAMAAGETQPGAPLWILVTPPALRSAMETLAQFRASEGFKVAVIEIDKIRDGKRVDEDDATAIQDRIRELCGGGKTNACVLLAGAMTGSDAAIEMTVPSLRGSHARMKGKQSDHPYGLPGQNGLATIAVGRFPARTADEASQMVQKTIRFETNLPSASWRNRLVLLIGNPGGGPLPEMFVQQTIGPHLAMLNPIWEVRAIFNASSSRYFMPTERLRDASIRYLEAGELFSFYLGHSGPEGLWSISTNFLSREDWARLKMPEGNGVFFTCGCFACQPGDRGSEGYALSAMRNSTGPVAVIGATAESYSAPGQLAVEGLMGGLEKHPFPKRLGEYWLAVQSGLASGKMDEGVFSLYDQADGSGGKIPLATQRLEHLEMWMLLGDPAMSLPLPPVEIDLKAGDTVMPGGRFKVTGHVPKRLAGAKIHVTLERPLNSTPQGMDPLPANTPENRESRARIAFANLERANALALVTTEVLAEGEQFVCELTAPLTIPWSNVIVRASAGLNDQFAVGVLSIPVSQDGKARSF
jgi:hypothetical protein